MSHSQICYEELSLKHAWLNLWDKHMTTGRINQVFTWRFTPTGQEKHLGVEQPMSPEVTLCSLEYSLPRAWKSTLGSRTTNFAIRKLSAHLNTPSRGPGKALSGVEQQMSPKVLFRMRHTSPDKAPNAAYSTDCTKYKSGAAQSLPAEGSVPQLPD